jgi:hypothetical protein
MSVSDTTMHAGADAISGSRIPSRLAPMRYVALFVGVILAGSLAVAAMNYWLDPLSFNSRFQSHVAGDFEGGRNYAVYDPNLDFRGLRREHIRRMSATPDVVVFAGSRFELATKNLFPHRSFYNAFVHSDYFEDLLAITELLHANNRLPKSLVLSVRFATFLPVAERETEEWKMFWPEYRAMADRLGIEKVPFTDNFPWRHWSQLLSIEALKHRFHLQAAKGLAPGATSADRLSDFDVLRADGSLAFSDQHQGTFTGESSRDDAVKRASKVAKKTNWPMDRARIAALAPLLAFVRQQGTRTAIAITPHHPAYWAGIADAPYGRTLQTIEAEVQKVAKANGAVLVGSFDPAKAGCVESSFRDYIHLDEVCLKTVFDQIPS